MNDCQSSCNSVSPSTVEKYTISKRRSLVKRRSLCFDKLGDNRCRHEDSQFQIPLEENKATNRQLDEYLEKLRFENVTWKIIQEERKQHLKKVHKKLKAEAIILDWDSCENILTDQDKTFLKNTPNYEKIMSNLNKLEKMAGIYKHQEQKTVHMTASLLAFVEQTGVEVEKKMLEHLTSLYK